MFAQERELIMHEKEKLFGSLSFTQPSSVFMMKIAIFLLLITSALSAVRF